jgi:hypothetical protein
MIKELMAQIKWMLLALIISLVFVSGFDGTVLKSGTVLVGQQTFLGLNFVLKFHFFCL